VQIRGHFCTLALVSGSPGFGFLNRVPQVRILPGAPFRIHTLDDMIENVSEPAPALAPLFRSDQQMRILAVLFAVEAGELSVGELAQRAGVAQATASREIARLAQHGLVVTRSLGRNTLVSANWGLAWARDLRSILVQTIGVLGLLSDALSAIPGVDEAYVFGSWAVRYHGEPGLAPNDIDLLVIGEPDLDALYTACRRVETQIHLDVNPVVRSKAQWQRRASQFLRDVRDGPLVPVMSTP
jgi:DNA-binding transcriptional ArsR family regulator